MARRQSANAPGKAAPDTGAPGHGRGHDSVRLAVIIGALGVVFGDIGTSPIYTLQTVFSPDDPHPVPVSTDNVFGVVSLIFWSVMIIVTVTYVLLAMRADNDGEGAIMALITLLRRSNSPRGRRTVVALAALGIFGAALFFGDSMITPAISVLSAVEGIKVAQPSLEGAVVPMPPNISASPANAPSSWDPTSTYSRGWAYQPDHRRGPRSLSGERVGPILGGDAQAALPPSGAQGSLITVSRRNGWTIPTPEPGPL